MGKRWTLKETNTFIEMYQTHHIDEICDALSRNRYQLYDKAKLLKLKRPNHWRSKHCPLPVSTSGQFKKGHQTWNKGLKGLEIGGKETQFKKGAVPHNKLPEELREITKQLSRLKKNIQEREKRNAKG
jgi:hypothetical protein